MLTTFVGGKFSVGLELLLLFDIRLVDWCHIDDFGLQSFCNFSDEFFEFFHYYRVHMDYSWNWALVRL